MDIILLTVVYFIIQAKEGRAGTGKDEQRLYEYITQNKLPKACRPSLNTDKPVEVKFGIDLQELQYLDTTTDTILLSVWLNLLWDDPYLKWNESEFGGIKSIRLPTEEVWNPDIELYNMRTPLEKHNTDLVVYSSGQISHVPPTVISTGCEIDLSNFPFDTQVCLLKFGSWTYDGSKLNLTLLSDHVIVTTYSRNPAWDLISYPVNRNVMIYDCCAEPYIDMTFHLTFKRRTSYYTYVFIGPVVILSLLSPFVFLLPPGDQQKMTLGIGLLICFTLFFVEMNSVMPNTNSFTTPLIAKYYMTMYVLLSLAMALSAFISNIARKAISIKHPPQILKKVMLNGLGKCMCLSQDMYLDLSAGDVKSPTSPTLDRLDSIEEPAKMREWLLIATVVDRLFFIVYLIGTVIITIIVLV